jgi:small conductance mechanosensitive channel
MAGAKLSPGCMEREQAAWSGASLPRCTAIGRHAGAPTIFQTETTDGMFSPRSLDTTAEWFLAWTVSFLPRVALALVILAAGLMAARWAGRAAAGLLRRAGHVDPTVQPVISAVVRYGLTVLVAIWALGQVGVQTASLLAVLGAAGLAIGLALQGTLTNIAAGIMLLWLRPFRVGDYIEVATAPIAGTVLEIGLFACQLRTFDGLFIFAPNQTLWNAALRNHSRNAGRLVVVSVTLPAAADPDRARGLIEAGVRATNGIAGSPQPDVHVESVTASGLALVCRVWAAHQDVGAVQRDLVDRVRRALADAGAEEYRPIQVVRTVPPEADPSRLIP